jgi:signal peptidase II
MNKRPIWALVISGFCLDQLSKIAAVTYLTEPFIIISERIIFQLVYNFGAAYGILQNQRVFLLSMSVIVIGGAIYWSESFIQSIWSRWGISFLLIGAFGNFFDRLRLGYVIDFIDIKLFPVFNIADVCIDIAIVLFIIEMIKKPNELHSK